MIPFRIVALVAALILFTSYSTGPARASLLWEFGFVGMVDCNGGFQAFRSAKFGGEAFLRPIHEVPEPPTIGLFSLALVALAAAALWNRRRRPSGERPSGV